jgi:AraC-like DNA-binding protein
MDNYQIINYWDILLSCAMTDERRCTNKAREHMLVHVYSGELQLNEKEIITTVEKGKCAFIRKDNQLQMNKSPKDGELFKAVYLFFKRDFLRRTYQSLDRKKLPLELKRSEMSVYKMPESPAIMSLFLSITPYFNTSLKPTEEWAKLKLQEGLMALLNTDERFYPCLFDFTEPWKIDILDFMNDNYMYDLTMTEIASYTGRSLASFKRDFAKISNLSPEKWLINKRLEVARIKLEDKNAKVSDVCYDVGFKNLSHFSKIYKETFGYAPSK